MFYSRFGKRIFDIFLSGIAIILLSPLLILVYILVLIKMGKPVIFIQERPGLNERVFQMKKFRTMLHKVSADDEIESDENRLTSFGKFLRSTSLDELPGLFNILVGDMSVVGPRPLLVEYLPLYNPNQKVRHNVRPGLTGLAQVNGRNAISWEERLNLDIDYVNNITFLNDLKIIGSTFKKVLIREGVSSTDSVTMEKFTGTDSNRKANDSYE